MRMQLHADMSTAELEQRVTAHRAVVEAEHAQQQALAQIGSQTAMAFGDQLAQMVIAVASGEKSIGEALEGFVSQILMQMGTMLISTGFAGLALQALSIIPGLQGFTGVPGLGVPASLAAIALGTAMVGGASMMPGGARHPGTPSGGGGTPPQSRPPSIDDMAPRGFAGLGAAGAAPYTVNISFSGVVGDERRAARMIEDVLRRGR